jgi:wyosine [tRNA(Phe)-imidazoG37] synthetase (radical SAM superfamily)
MKLENRIVYGPVLSRRFGWDLGINLLPVTRKLCCFDCIYCQYGFTPASRETDPSFPSASDLLSAWSREFSAAAARNILIEHATISGNGEPAMHPDFAGVVRTFIGWRDRHYPNVKIAILTTGYRLEEPDIRSAMALLDQVIVKLDAGSEDTWRRIDRPRSGQSFHVMKSHFKNVEHLIIQSMFLKGWNDQPAEIESWISALREIGPKSAQIYTLDRKPAMTGLQPVGHRFLVDLAARASAELDIPVTPY